MGQKPSTSWEQESGQLLINKAAAWKALNLCVHLNSEFYMRLLNGDKDTFRFAWLAANVPFFSVPTLPVAVGARMEQHSDKQTGFCGHTMLQFDLDGQPLFVHHNQLKSVMLPAGQNFQVMKRPTGSSPFRAVPVQGLRLRSGRVLPCIDVQGPWVPKIDDMSFPMETSPLADFERRFFAAKATVPQRLFTSSKTTLPGASTDTMGSSLAVSGLGKKKLMRAMRADKNTTCGRDQFELEAPTASTDRECEQVTVCGADQVELVAPTATSDRVCQQTTVPSSVRRFAVRVVEPKSAAHPYAHQGANKAYEIRDVTVGGLFVEAPELTLTHLQSYEFVMENVPASEPFFVTESETGGAGASAYTTGVHGADSTGTDVLTFTPPTSAPATLFYHSHGSSHMGWKIRVQPPSYAAMHTGHHGSHSGPFMRFSTAFSDTARLFELTVPASAIADGFGSVLTSCQAQCSQLAACRGVFAYRTTALVACTGLSDLSGEPTPTAGDNQSFLKIVQ